MVMMMMMMMILNPKYVSYIALPCKGARLRRADERAQRGGEQLDLANARPALVGREPPA